MKPTLHHVAAFVVLLSGCATHPPAIFSMPGSMPLTNRLNVQFQAAVLASDSAPATYSFQEAKGKLGSASEALSEATEIALGSPALGVIVPGEIIGATIHSAYDEGQLLFGTAVAGAAGVVAAAGAAVAAPAVATKGLIRSRKTVSPQELTEREADLREALKEAASQERFQHFLLASADQSFPGRLVADKPQATPSTVDAVFDARIEDLRLEREGSDEGTYFLRIKSHARLVRRDGGGLLYEQSVEYRSGRALFLDWTYHGALEGVAQTGYRALAEYFVNLIFQAR